MSLIPTNGIIEESVSTSKQNSFGYLVKTCRNFSRNVRLEAQISLMINANGCSNVADMWKPKTCGAVWAEMSTRFLFKNTHYNDWTMNDKSLIIFFPTRWYDELSLWHKIIWKFDVILNVTSMKFVLSLTKRKKKSIQSLICDAFQNWIYASLW